MKFFKTNKQDSKAFESKKVKTARVSEASSSSLMNLGQAERKKKKAKKGRDMAAYLKGLKETSDLAHRKNSEKGCSGMTSIDLTASGGSDEWHSPGFSMQVGRGKVVGGGVGGGGLGTVLAPITLSSSKSGNSEVVPDDDEAEGFMNVAGGLKRKRGLGGGGGGGGAWEENGDAAKVAKVD